MTITILKAVLVIVILAGMILLLLGLNHLFAGGFHASREDEEELREELEESADVVTGHSVFRELVKVREQAPSRFPGDSRGN